MMGEIWGGHVYAEKEERGVHPLFVEIIIKAFHALENTARGLSPYRVVSNFFYIKMSFSFLHKCSAALVNSLYIAGPKDRRRALHWF
jgi:hypothetical protein